MQFFTPLGRFFTVQHNRLTAIILLCIVIHPIRRGLLKLGAVICRPIRSSSKKLNSPGAAKKKKKEKNEYVRKKKKRVSLLGFNLAVTSLQVWDRLG